MLPGTFEGPCQGFVFDAIHAHACTLMHQRLALNSSYDTRMSEASKRQGIEPAAAIAEARKAAESVVNSFCTLGAMPQIEL